MSSRAINLVAALPAEAKPVVSRFRLERLQPDPGFPLYRRGHISLVVCGPGKVNAAAATSFLGASSSGKLAPIWVNLGIAGHAERPVGQVVLASCIKDAGSGQVWSPVLMDECPCPTDSLLTLDQPDTLYEGEGMIDMEASGFFPTACRYSNAELVQVLKVISDNRANPAHGLSGKQARRLIEGVLEPLEALLASLMLGAEPQRGVCRKQEVH